MSIIAKYKRYKIRRYLKKNYPKVEIGRDFIFEKFNSIVFKGYCYIGPESYWAAIGGIEIGDNVIFGPRTTLWTYNHNYNSKESIPYGGDDIFGKIVIEDNVWVGLGAVILPGVIIGEGAVIGAGSVVANDISSCSIVVGNPAKEVKKRNLTDYQELKNSDKRYLKLKREL